MGARPGTLSAEPATGRHLPGTIVGVPYDPILPAEYLKTLADGTVKQVNPFTGTQVWTIPGRANRPLGVTPSVVKALDDQANRTTCAFCTDRYADNPPEKERSVRRGAAFERRTSLTLAEARAEIAEFRRVPNLYEIISVDYWETNYGYRLPRYARERCQSYAASPGGREHLLDMIRRRLGSRAAEMSEDELVQWSAGFFGSAHDLIVARRHFVDGATTDDQLASSGTLTPEEHREYIGLTVEAMADLYETNRYIRNVAVFQNWLRPAGASFDHLHKQLVGIDERGVQAELEIRAVRENPNVFNDKALNYAARHDLIVAENAHAIATVGFGHRFPSLEIWSTSPTSHPWRLRDEERDAMADLMHAMHAATGADVPCNEEWHARPLDADVPIPWHVVLKWRVSTLAGFEGGTKIYLNTISPYALRHRVLPALEGLREDGRLAGGIRIGEECSHSPNPLRYNPNLAR